MATGSSVDKILRMVDVCGGTDEKKKSFIDRIKAILPPQVKNKDRFALMFEEVVNNQLASNYITDKKSVLPCVFQAAKFGLYPDPAMGLIYFVPYKGKLTYQLGYRGMVQLARNSGLVADIRSGLVYEKEVKSGDWEYYEDEKGQHYRHKPSMERERGPLHCGYSLVTMTSGETFIHVMEAHRIDDIKKMVLARTPKSPWSDALALPEMQKKTVVRRHCKMLTLSPDLVIAAEDEERIERGEEQQHSIDGILDSVEAPEVADSNVVQSDPSVPVEQSPLAY